MMNMELLYFIAGILSVGVMYGVILLRKVRSTYTELLDKTNLQSNLTSIRVEEVEKDMGDFKELIFDIKNKMDNDQYESIAEINRRIKELNTVAYGNLDKINFADQKTDGNFSTIFTELGQLKQTVKIMGQDPNFTRTF